MKVICIDDRPPMDAYAAHYCRFPNGHVVKGEEYTVADCYNATEPPHRLCYVLEEKPIEWNYLTVGWGAFRFVAPEYFKAEFTETKSEAVTA